MPQEQVSVAPPVPAATRPEGPDWHAFAARRIAEHAAAGDRGAVLRFVHELEHKLGSRHLYSVNPWRVVEHLADRMMPGPDPEPPAGTALAQRETAAVAAPDPGRPGSPKAIGIGAPVAGALHAGEPPRALAAGSS